MSLTRTDFELGYKRLLSAFDKPFKADKAEVYFRSLGHRFQAPGWVQAIDRAISECERFPEVSVLIALYYRAKREAQAVHRGPLADLPPCPNCGQPSHYAGFELPNGDVLPRLRCACPPYGAGWATAKAKAWRETHPAFLEKA